MQPPKHLYILALADGTEMTSYRFLHFNSRASAIAHMRQCLSMPRCMVWQAMRHEATIGTLMDSMKRTHAHILMIDGDTLHLCSPNAEGMPVWTEIETEQAI